MANAMLAAYPEMLVGGAVVAGLPSAPLRPYRKH